jgi:hypothetical protein
MANRLPNIKGKPARPNIDENLQAVFPIRQSETEIKMQVKPLASAAAINT